MHVSARSDYAVRALIVLVREGGGPCTADFMAKRQDIPSKFLNAVLRDLKKAALIGSQRGMDGGYYMVREPKDIAVADIMRAVEGQLADVRGIRPENLSYVGEAEPLQEVWIAARAAMRSVLDHTTLADLTTGNLPDVVKQLAISDEAWN